MLAGSPPEESLDLLIAGGRVIDPARKIDALLDVGIAGSRIVAVAPSLPRDRTTKVFDARGKIVTPGLIDMHGHVFDQFLPVSIDPDLIGIPKGVTTIVDAGSAGANTFPGFREYVIERAATRVCALLNISNIGLVVQNELYLDPKRSTRTRPSNDSTKSRDDSWNQVRITGHDERCST